MSGAVRRTILEVIRDQPGLSGWDIARAAKVSVNGIYVHLGRLMKKGLVRLSVEHSRTGIQRRHFLTAEGERVLRAAEWLEEEREASS